MVFEAQSQNLWDALYVIHTAIASMYTYEKTALGVCVHSYLSTICKHTRTTQTKGPILSITVCEIWAVLVIWVKNFWFCVKGVEEGSLHPVWIICRNSTSHVCMSSSEKEPIVSVLVSCIQCSAFSCSNLAHVSYRQCFHYTRNGAIFPVQINHTTFIHKKSTFSRFFPLNRFPGKPGFSLFQLHIAVSCLQ